MRLRLRTMWPRARLALVRGLSRPGPGAAPCGRTWRAMAAGAACAAGLLAGCSDPAPPSAPTPGAPPSVAGAPAGAAVAAAPTVTILKWGPQSTRAGTGFAVQKSGNSALWFEQRGVHSADSVEVWFDQTRLPGMALTPNEGGSAEVPPELLAKPGRYAVYLKLVPGGQRVDLGEFEVTP